MIPADIRLFTWLDAEEVVLRWLEDNLAPEWFVDARAYWDGIAVRIGAVLSTGITLYAGRRNPSRLLIGLFVIWVLLPFVAMLWADIASRGWPVGLRATFYGVMLLITAGSVGIYGIAVLNPPEKGAFVFLTVPLASWVLIAGWMAAGYFGSRKRRDTMGA